MSQTISGNLSVSGSTSLTSASCSSLTATTCTVSTLNASNLNATISQLTVPQLLTNNISNSVSISTPQLFVSTKNVGTAIQTLDDKNVVDRQNITNLQTKTTNVNYNTTSLTTTINGLVDVPNTMTVGTSTVGTLTSTTANIGTLTATTATIGTTTLTGNVTLSGNITANGKSISPIELSYIDGCTGTIQNQINNTNTNVLNSSVKIAALEVVTAGQTYNSANDTTTIDNNMNITKNLTVSGDINVTGNINVNGTSISTAELSYLDNCTSNIQTQLNSATTRLNTIETTYNTQVVKIPTLETKLTEVAYYPADRLTTFGGNTKTELDILGTDNQSQLRNITIYTDSINCHNIKSPSVTLINNATANALSAYPFSVKIAEIVVPRNSKVSIDVVSPFAFYGSYSSGSLPQTQIVSVPSSGISAIASKRLTPTSLVTTSNITFTTATNAPTVNRTFVLSSASSTYNYYVNNAIFTLDLPLNRWGDELFDIHIDFQRIGMMFNTLGVGQALTSTTSSVAPESNIYRSPSMNPYFNSIANTTTGTVQMNSIQCNDIFSSVNVNMRTNLVYPNLTKTIVAPACSTPAWLINAASADVKIDRQYPIMCSLKKLGKVDDYFIVAPGYKLIVYTGLVYTGTGYTIDNTSGVTNLFKRSVDAYGNTNQIDSCRLYYNGIEITVPEWST